MPARPPSPTDEALTRFLGVLLAHSAVAQLALVAAVLVLFVFDVLPDRWPHLVAAVEIGAVLTALRACRS